MDVPDNLLSLFLILVTYFDIKNLYEWHLSRPELSEGKYVGHRKAGAPSASHSSFHCFAFGSCPHHDAEVWVCDAPVSTGIRMAAHGPAAYPGDDGQLDCPGWERVAVSPHPPSAGTAFAGTGHSRR